jgi:hypothetical protein
MIRLESIRKEPIFFLFPIQPPVTLRVIFPLLITAYLLMISFSDAPPMARLAFGGADKDKQTSAWKRVKGNLVTIKDNILLDNVIKSQIIPRENGVFLFETGDYSYKYQGDSLRLLLGKKWLDIKQDVSMDIPCWYPETKIPINLPFWFRPVSPAAYSYQAKSAVVFPLDKYELVALDWNHNGYFDDFNADRYMIIPANSFLKKERTAQDYNSLLKTWTGFITIEKEGTHLVGIKPPWELYLWKVSDTLKEDYLIHMGYLNHLRKLQGANLVGIDETLILACEKHCLYCSKHGIGHEEDPGKEGYSPEGNRQGMNSVVGGHSNSLAGIKGMFSTLYHRNFFLMPYLTRVSLGCRDGVYICDVQTFSSGGTNKLICYPFPRQIDVEVRGQLERPRQVPDNYNGPLGALIAIRFQNGWTPKLHSATIRNVKTNQEVPFRYTDPHCTPSEAQKQFPTNDSCICLFPTQLLDKGVIYEVTINYFNSPLDAKKDKPPQSVKWRFRTEDEPSEESDDE